MPYVALRPMNVSGRLVHAGDPVPEFENHPSLHAYIRKGQIMLVPEGYTVQRKGKGWAMVRIGGEGHNHGSSTGVGGVGVPSPTPFASKKGKRR